MSGHRLYPNEHPGGWGWSCECGKGSPDAYHRSEGAALAAGRRHILAAETHDSGVTVLRFRERYMTCASCRSEARWMVCQPGAARGATSCDRHLELWKRRQADPEPAVSGREDER